MLRGTGRCCARVAGIIGLPNIGKSTLFNALTCSQQAKTGNYPFCTIDANIGKATVIDPRARALAEFTKAPKIVDVELELADVAGLIAGASKGAGLGNKFLADIRPCKVLLHVVRCFESRRDGFDTPTPLEDIATITNELVLADLEVAERRVHKLRKTRKSSDPELAFVRRVLAHLEQGRPATSLRCEGAAQELAWLRSCELLSGKPTVFVLNVEEDAVRTGNAASTLVEQSIHNEEQSQEGNKDGSLVSAIRVSALLEEQTAQLGERAERLAFLREYGLTEAPSEQLLRRVMSLLRLQTFFTVGPQMVHGWSVTAGATARTAAGVIHSNFAKYFVKARVMPWRELLAKPNLESAEMQMRAVDDKYVMQDGDVLIVDHNAPSS